MDEIEALAKKSSDLKAEYAALDPAVVREALSKIITCAGVKDAVAAAEPLFEALPAGDPLKHHIAGWLQINKAVAQMVGSKPA